MNDSKDPKVHLYITIVEDGVQLYFGLLIDVDSKGYLVYEKFQWDKEWSHPPINIDVSDKTIPSEIRKKSWFRLKMEQGHCYVQHPLRSDGFHLRCIPGQNYLIEIVGRPSIVKGKIFQIPIDESDKYEDIVDNEILKQIVSREIDNFQTRNGKVSKISQHLQPAEILVEHLRRWTFPNTRVSKERLKTTTNYHMKVSKKREGLFKVSTPPNFPNSFLLRYPTASDDEAKTRSDDEIETISDVVDDDDDDDDEEDDEEETEKSSIEDKNYNDATLMREDHHVKITYVALLANLDYLYKQLDPTNQFNDRVEVLQKYPRENQCWYSVQFAGYVAAYAVFKYKIKYDENFKVVLTKYLNDDIVINSALHVQTFDLTVGQLILLNRLYQFIALSHCNNVVYWSLSYFDSWEKQVYKPVKQHLKNIFYQNSPQNAYDIHLRICNLFQDLFVVDSTKDRATETSLESLTTCLSDLISKSTLSLEQKLYVTALKNMIEQFPRLSLADCQWTHSNVSDFLRDNRSESNACVIFMLALAFPSFTYRYGFNVRQSGALSYILINFPLSVRYMILSCFDPSRCCFCATDTRFLPHRNSYIQQMLEYCLVSKLGLVFEESLEVIEYVRERNNILFLYLLNDSYISAEHAFVENKEIIDRLRKLNPGFKKDYDSTIHCIKQLSMDLKSRSYPFLFLSKNPDLNLVMWKTHDPILSHCKLAVRSVRDTIMHVYFGNFKIIDLQNYYDYNFKQMWSDFLNNIDASENDYFNDGTDEVNFVDLSTFVPLESTLVTNRALSERNACYVASSVIDGLLHRNKAHGTNWDKGYARTLSSVKETIEKVA